MRLREWNICEYQKDTVPRQSADLSIPYYKAGPSVSEWYRHENSVGAKSRHPIFGLRQIFGNVQPNKSIVNVIDLSNWSISERVTAPSTVIRAPRRS